MSCDMCHTSRVTCHVSFLRKKRRKTQIKKILFVMELEIEIMVFDERSVSATLGLLIIDYVFVNNKSMFYNFSYIQC